MHRIRRTFPIVAIAMMLVATLWAPGGAVSAAPPRLKDLTITDRISGGDTVNARVILSRPAAADVRVSLSSSNPTILQIADSIVVKKGRTTAQTDASTVKVGKRTKVVITASVPGSASTETVTISPVRLLNISSPTTMDGGASSYGTVRLTDIAPIEGLVVRLNSNRPSVLQVPETVTFLGGRETARFPITTTNISTDVLVNITARLSGSPNAVDTTRVLGSASPATPTATATTVPPTSTTVPPTATTVPPTATTVPPTATTVPPTSTTVPPTSTPVPPTATTVPQPTIDFNVIVEPVLGVTPAIVQVCWADPVPSLILAADVSSTNPAVAVVDLDLTFTEFIPCHDVVVVGLLSGDTQLKVTINGVDYFSEVIDFALL